MKIPVVNTTFKIRGCQGLRCYGICYSIRNLLITGVIAIIEWTVDTVKLLNNVVVGNGN